jgi:hypothetical protein
VVATLSFVPPALADEAPPPPTTPTSTTPDAPPPDPYHPPPKVSKPKAPASTRSAPAVPHAPTVRVRTYSPPPAAAPAPVVRGGSTHRVQRPRAKQVVHHKRRAHVVHRHVAPKPKPVKVEWVPFAQLAATANLALPAGDSSSRDRYLWFAGFAFAVLAVAGLSLHLLSLRAVRVE